MLKELQLGVCAFHVGYDSTLLALRNELPVPRYTASIVTGICVTFPELNRTDVLGNIGQIMPALISLIEETDIGVSAYLRKIDTDTSRNLRLLHDETSHHLSQYINGKSEKPHGVITAFNDFRLLSRIRRQFKGDDKRWIELDSGIVEAICIAAASPHLLDEIYLNLDQKPPDDFAESKDYLLEKYKFFLLGSEASQNSQKAVPLRALHALEMYMKLDDDKNGSSIDKLLQLPSSRNIENVDEVRSCYYEIAQDMFTPLQIKLISGVRNITSVMRSNRVGKKADRGFYPVDMSELVRHGHAASSNLRHIPAATDINSNLAYELNLLR